MFGPRCILWRIRRQVPEQFVNLAQNPADKVAAVTPQVNHRVVIGILLRTFLLARGGQIEPFVQGQFRFVFGQTDTTRWRLTETIFWRKSEGAGETTSLDFEAAIRKDILFRWFNDATVSESTRLLRWVSGTSLYFDLGNRRAAQAQFTMNGDTGEPVDVANYGVRLSYRRSIGRPWLIGEAYVGHDYPKIAPGIDRLSQTFVGLRLELQFDRGPESTRPSAP